MKSQVKYYVPKVSKERSTWSVNGGGEERDCVGGTGGRLTNELRQVDQRTCVKILPRTSRPGLRQ